MSVSEPKQTGKLPVKEFSYTWKTDRACMEQRDGGIDPVSAFSYRYKYRSVDSDPMLDGRVP